MDMDTIEAYADHTLDIASEDIKERTVALGGAINFMKLKAEMADDTADQDTLELLKRVLKE